MALKLMYITNLPEVAKIAEEVGVDRIFVDLEYIGKNLRQGGMDTVQSKHTLEDVRRISESLKSAELWFVSIRFTKLRRNTGPRRRKSILPLKTVRIF